MGKIEVECCDSTHIHTTTIHQVEEHMPQEETLTDLADFFKVFGDATRVKNFVCIATVGNVRV